MTGVACEAEIIDGGGILTPCDRTPVGYRDDPEGPWPACAEHLHAVYLGGGRWERP